MGKDVIGTPRFDSTLAQNIQHNMRPTMAVKDECYCSGITPSYEVPIAIVGLACRLAGSATNPDALWQMLSKGKSGWSRGAGARFNLAAFYHPSAVMDGTFNAQGMHLLKQDISHFDNQMFNVSAVEAKAIDPQQRLLLEVAYEAFENAGMMREDLCSSETGVYSAVFNHDYESIQSRDPEISPSYRFTGTGPALVSNRISYVFDLRGPSITLDTACSGSLVAVHQACQAIRSGEIRQALVGGTNLILDPEYMASMSSMQVLSDHGRCYAFDSRAGGFGRGEGVAAIVVKRLDDAIRDGDSIRSIIRGSAINQDGRTPGITMPSHAAQVEVISKAYAQAGLDPKHTCYVEAHGTGTKVGDKTEAGALAQTFARERTANSPLYVGSIKTNIGHTESAAGLAGLLKAVLVLEKGIIPPNINFAQANNAISLGKWHLKIPQKSIPWPENQVRRASVNSFGYGGSNAHVILDGADEYLNTHCLAIDEPIRNDPGRKRLFVLTHNTDQGVGKFATNLKRYVARNDNENTTFLDSLAYTLNSRRSKLAFRVAFSATDYDELTNTLDDISKGIVRPSRALEEPKLCFAFTGQGAQWACMGKELSSVYPIFADAMRAAEKHLIALGADWSLTAELNKPIEESRINEARISQPCCTAIQLALVDLLGSWNVRPDVVCGHSSGEIGASYAAGFITATDALNIAFHRGEAVDSLRSLAPELEGGMLAVGLSAQAVQRYIRHDSLGAMLEKVVVACVNSPSSVTLSGDMSPLKDIQQRLESDGIFNRMLLVDVAYHSHHMDLVRDQYLSAMKDLKPSHPSKGVCMISSVTGERIVAEELDACYWAQNMVSSVLFAPALEKAVKFSSATGSSSTSTVDVIVEIGPHAALAGPIKQTLKALSIESSAVKYLSAITRNTDATKTVVDVAGGLACCGWKVDFSAVNNPKSHVQAMLLSDLPTYNWHHVSSHWSEGRVSAQYRNRHFPRHDLLGIPCNDSIALEPRWRNYIRVKEVPWVRGHIFQGQIIFPASGYLCAAIEAVRQVTLDSGHMWKDMVCRFRQVNCGNALIIPDDVTGIETLFSLRPYTYSARESSSSWREFRMFSISATGETTEHCRGLVSTARRLTGDPVVNQREKEHFSSSTSHNFEKSKEEFLRLVSPKRFYEDLKSLGVEYTGPFANITNISVGSRGALCDILIPETKSDMPGMFEQPHCMHPATLDMCFQTPFTCLRTYGDMKNTLVITHIKELDISSDISATTGTTFVAHALAEPYGFTKFKASVAVIEGSKLSRPPVINVQGLIYTDALEFSSGASRPPGEYLCHQMKWAIDTSSAKSKDILSLYDKNLTETSATKRRDSYDAYAQKVIHSVLSVISAEDEARMEDHHKKLLSWMRVHKSALSNDSQSVSRSVVESLGVDGKMLVRVGDQMLDILRGKADALTILLKEDLLYEVYSNENTHRCHAQLDKYLRLLKFKNPRMNILEIGAGTAGTTVPVLEAFSTLSDGLVQKSSIDKYIFTDISSGFFEKSKQKLQAWQDILEFKKLDIEADTEAQGFINGTFDLVIASNVLHATKNIAHTLGNVRRLLKPGGKLVMVEITEPHMTWPMIVGTLPGWWLGAAEGRLDSPSLKSSGWDKVLRLTQFSGIDFELKDYALDYEHQLSVLVSTAKLEKPACHYPPINILCHEMDTLLADTLCDLIKQTNPETKVKRQSMTEFEPSDNIYIVLHEATLPVISQCDWRTFDDVKQLLTKAKNILWITAGATINCEEPERAMITGLARTARSEDHSLNLVTLDLDPNEDSLLESAKQVKKILDLAFVCSGCEKSLSEFEYAVRDRVVLIPRISDDELLHDYVCSSVDHKPSVVQPISQSGRFLDLHIETPGLLETFYWADSKTHSREPGPEELRIKIEAIPLNFKDLMTAMGQLDGLNAMLIECSGVVEEVGTSVGNHFRPGDRVCALGYRSFATTSNVDHRLVQHIPEGLSPVAAAAIQISYSTALYTLRDVARMQAGESVLIHSAAGGFGQAAIAIARYMGAGQIYATVGSAEKKTFIMEKFGIPADHIFSSRNLTFKDGLMRLTKESGVDVILNSLSGEAMFESYKCLARFGRFVEIGKKDLLSNTRLEMQHLENNSSLSIVDLSMLMEFKPAALQEILSTVFDLISKRKVEILSPIVTKRISDLESAFRLMQSGKHIGKIVMTLDDDACVKIERPRVACPKLDDESSYLIIGGTGGLGKAIIRHLTKIGAKHIIAMSRSGAGDREIVALIEECRSAGSSIQIQQGSVLNIDDLRAAVDLAGQRPIRGVIQGAMVLKDCLLSNMSFEQWHAVVSPKVRGTLNLHSVFGNSLDFFIILSSGTGIIGSYGQGNYSAGNTFQDAFSRWRTAHGFPARTIDLGPVEGEGYAAENENALEFTLRQGMGVVKLQEVMALIDHAITYPLANDAASSQNLAATRRAHPGSGSEEAAIQRIDPKFSHLWTASSGTPQSTAESGEFDIQGEIRSATSLHAAVGAIQLAIVSKLSKLLAMPVGDISLERPVGAYGMDSLISVELRNWMAMQLESHVQQFELMGAKSIQDLGVLVAKRSRLVPAILVTST